MATISPVRTLDVSTAKPLASCPQITVEAFSYSDVGALPGVEYRTWNAVIARHASWTALMAEEPTWEDVMAGHPGHTGGGAIAVKGSGMLWGYTVDGVEFWLTEVEGLEDSPGWDASLSESALLDGSWLSRVTAKGRPVTIKGVAIAPDVTKITKAKATLAAALAVRPRTGLLRYRGLGLPVAITSAVKMRHIGTLSVEVEVSLVGIDMGRNWPGGGVFLQGDATTYRLTNDVWTDYGALGSVACPARLSAHGPIPAAAYVEFSAADSRTTLTFQRDIPAGQTIDVDARTRSVLWYDDTHLDGVPDYAAVRVDQWPMLSPEGGSMWLQGSGSGIVNVVAAELY